MISMISELLELLDDAGRRRLRLMMLLQAGQGVLQGLGILFVVPLITALLSSPVRVGAALAWLAAVAAAVAIHHVLLAGATALGYRVGTDVLTSFHSRIANHLATLPIGWFRSDRTGPIGRLLGKGTMDVANVPAHLLRYVVIGVTMPVTMIVGAVVLDWRIGTALLIGGMLCAAALKLLMVVVHRNDEAYDADIGATASKIVEFAQLQPVLRAFGALSRPEIGTLDSALSRQQQSQRRLTIRGAGALMIFFGGLQLVISAVVALAVVFAVSGSLEISALIGVLIIGLRMIDPISQLGELAGQIQINADAIMRVRRLLAVPALPEPVSAVRPNNPGVRLDRVTFGYDEGSPVLQDVDLEIPPRSLTAIVGPSGSGKTTVLRLISRFFDTDRGAVRIGDVDVRDLGSAAVADLTAPVFQDIYLFEGTIADNLRVAAPDAPDEDLDRVARLARLDEVITRLPNGWNTRVGEGGSTLSGGEKQRVSIARALLKDAPIVLFDEATASLDPLTEEAVAAAIGELSTDRTVIVVAHRLQTVVAADRIVVIDRGRFTESGTHHDLLAQDGTYAGFWTERVRARGWQLRTGPEAPAPAPSSGPTAEGSPVR